MTASADLRRLLAEATPGPWTWLPEDKPPHRFGGEGSMDESGYAYSEPDLDLIVYLVNHASALADLIDAAKRVGEAPGLILSTERTVGAMASLRAAISALEGTTE